MRGSDTTSERELITVEKFTALSASIAYQLSLPNLDQDRLLRTMLHRGRFAGPMEPLIESVDFLRRWYGDRKRVNGSLAVLHPLRTTALLTRVLPHPAILDLFQTMFHDKDEDLTAKELQAEGRAKLEEEFKALMQKICSEDAWYLCERINLLTRGPESYFEYLGRIIDEHRHRPGFLYIKLADRLDNSLDLHVQQPGITKYNFYRIVFDLQFTPAFRDLNIAEYQGHHLPPVEEGMLLLSQLFKNCGFLTLIRQEGMEEDDIIKRLFDALAVASIRAAQWITLEVFANHLTETTDQRELLRSVMDYCQQGGSGTVRPKVSGDDLELDGTFSDCFSTPVRAERQERLAKLFANRERLAKLCITLISTFSSFLNDDDFVLQGISRAGVRPVTTP